MNTVSNLKICPFSRLSQQEKLELKRLGPDRPELIRSESSSSTSRKFSQSWYSAIHGEVYNLGASLDVITQMLLGTNCSGNISFITSFAEYFSVQEYLSGKFLNGFS